jgi:hypothetical protein
MMVTVAWTRREGPLVPFADGYRREQAGVVERFHGGSGGPRPAEHEEHRPQSLLHLLIGVEHHPAGGVVLKPDRNRRPELAPASLGHDPAPQASPEHVQLGLAHGALQPEQQADVERGRVVQAVLVQDEGAGQRADLEQSVPVGVVAGQAGHLQTEDDPRPAHPHLGHQALEPLPIDGGGPGVPLVGGCTRSVLRVRFGDALRPTVRHRTLPGGCG